MQQDLFRWDNEYKPDIVIESHDVTTIRPIGNQNKGV